MCNIQWKKRKQSCTTVLWEFDDEEEDQIEVDWLTASKKRKGMMLEDSVATSKRLQDHGVLLAERERYWEAIKYWDKALQYAPNSTKIHEMKSQVLLELEEVVQAKVCAEKAVQLDPTWAIARQTLGRTQLGLGDVESALQNFQKCLHLDPSNEEVLRDDLPWTIELVKKKRSEQTDSNLSLPAQKTS